MLRLTDIKLPLDHPESALRDAILARLEIASDELIGYTVAKRSYDARKRGSIVLIYSVDVETPREAELLRTLDGESGKAAAGGARSSKAGASKASSIKIGPTPDTSYKFVAQAPGNLPLRPLVIGMGPCGLFAGLLLAQMGFRPIILERGKAVRERTVDTFGLWRKRILNPESNVQFGEGGAGTFSDGKLHSQISDKLHHGRKVLREFVLAGAP
ncbi:MAG TPA: hypothetical protein VGE88_17240, partial [Lysobacter sp.]